MFRSDQIKSNILKSHTAARRMACHGLFLMAGFLIKNDELMIEVTLEGSAFC